ncbi:probable myosin-binding protein 5 [Tripterygium wilfordii]|uniref:probable myosin-binding protein 5 n=1 Tax=Tripterygium wilfordii TaxID=458696 RepID=UPI0018F823A0|nr:probable myosin-binding protein 5 [Tripterygium wilfordii]
MAKRTFKCFVEQELGRFAHFLIYAVLEWLLIILLFIDGLLAFLANEFAKFFELRIPCLLCTRIDHVLVRKSRDFYYNESICESHKKNVSSLAYCHVHKKLSDIRQMCEACLLSFATEKESDCDTYKSLVGILHKDIELFVDDDHEVHLSLPAGRKDDAQVEKSSIHKCSCCGEPLKVKSSYPKGKNGGMVSHAPAPSRRASFSARNDLDLPHIRYTELKFMPDNQSEVVGDEIIATNADVRSAVVPLLKDEDVNQDKTPNFGRGNRFFGIPLSDSATNSPRWGTRLQRRSLLEKTSELSAEPVEGDGESILHHLKRQVKLDRKSLMDLYMELDEERSASAVAANNAMAMITRLQAEKAAVQMEALQYQRMMEEQAEYDEEALQATKDLLAKRDEDIKVLEAEVDAYRLKFGDLREDNSDEDYQAYSSYGGRSVCCSPTSIASEGENNKEDDAPLHEETGCENLVGSQNVQATTRRKVLLKHTHISSHNMEVETQKD